MTSRGGRRRFGTLIFLFQVRYGVGIILGVRVRRNVGDARGFRSRGILKPDFPRFRISRVIRHERRRTDSALAGRRNFGYGFRFDRLGAVDVAPADVAGIHHQPGFSVARTYRAGYRFAALGVEIRFGIIAPSPALNFSHVRRDCRRESYRRVTYGFAVVGFARGHGELEGAAFRKFAGPVVGNGHRPGSVGVCALVEIDTAGARDDDVRAGRADPFDRERPRSRREADRISDVGGPRYFRNRKIFESRSGFFRYGKRFGRRRRGSVRCGRRPDAIRSSDHALVVFSGNGPVESKSASGNVVSGMAPGSGAAVAELRRSGSAPRYRIRVSRCSGGRGSRYGNGRRRECRKRNGQSCDGRNGL